MILQEYYVKKRDDLSQSAEDAAYDIKLLICTALGMSETTFFSNMRLDLTDEQVNAADALINRRLSGEPLQYILGKWSFMGLDFFVSPACLIPRQDTETLAEFAVNEVVRHKYNNVLDMCTGSGCIGITIAKKTAAHVTLSDVSTAALEIAAKNVELNATDADVIKSDMFDGINGTYDMITINPPYLTKDEMENLSREVKNEPCEALFGGDDGLKYYRIIAEHYDKHLNEGGMLIMEIGCNQSDAIRTLFPDAEIMPDLAGKDRVVVVRK